MNGGLRAAPVAARDAQTACGHAGKAKIEPRCAAAIFAQRRKKHGERGRNRAGCAGEIAPERTAAALFFSLQQDLQIGGEPAALPQIAHDGEHAGERAFVVLRAARNKHIAFIGPVANAAGERINLPALCIGGHDVIHVVEHQRVGRADVDTHMHQRRAVGGLLRHRQYHLGVQCVDKPGFEPGGERSLLIRLVRHALPGGKRREQLQGRIQAGMRLNGHKRILGFSTR